jgi:hypothetical protein
VYKLQRSKKILKEIESLPGEREQDLMMDDNSEFGSGRIVNRIH